MIWLVLDVGEETVLVAVVGSSGFRLDARLNVFSDAVLLDCSPGSPCFSPVIASSGCFLAGMYFEKRCLSTHATPKHDGD